MQRLREPKPAIVGTGAYVPAKILRNSDLERMVETSDHWIVERTGIRERRIAGEKECPSDMGAAAAMMALERADLQPYDLDLIIVATTTSDTLFPSTACQIQQKIGARKIPAFDLQAACSGFLYGLVMAHHLVAQETYRTILVIGAEKLSSIVNWTDRNTCVLFGDGAGAVIVRKSTEGGQMISHDLGSDGSQGQVLTVPAGGSRMPLTAENIGEGLQYIQMVGKKVFRLAVDAMESTARTCLKKAGLPTEEVSYVIPHQANLRIIELLAERLNLPLERFFTHLERYGNTSAACIPIALHEALTAGEIRPEEKVLLIAFGGGLTWASSLLEW
ncbi:beta-ketoacyl-ACP synthase III [Methylacidimicrobium sp. B4]|uniref:beta-ketoacyl-ACP synthase III n=1 Tax=Methylacidimicrobium sp. B4 TaxID=2796139 RepID=UPI001A8CE44F|nr:beta-ketoacyl-ACP synthase III [Methylacidimicrobium sp. B4]QSR85062.1 ketoacyl-ACP synthase III [Methylacidimicrobium sp. B4]